MTTIQTAQEQRVVLHDIGWGTYECLLSDYENRSGRRFTYDQGTLEVMRPLPEHEEYNRDLAMIVEIVAEESGISIRGLGATTFRREDLRLGFEPDSCFYIQNERRVRGKRRIELPADPPPDLVVEVDITHPSLDKLPIYARFGVPEVWRYDRVRLQIWTLMGGRYAENPQSHVLPGVMAEAVSGLVEEGRGSERVVWLRRVREWARGLTRADRPTI
jgi:Uma2 family endonuclease